MTTTQNSRKPYRRIMNPPIREGFERLAYFPCSLDRLLNRVDHNRKSSWLLSVSRHNSIALSGNHDQTCYLDCPFIGIGYPIYIFCDYYPYIIIEIADAPGLRNLSKWRISAFRGDLR